MATTNPDFKFRSLKQREVESLLRKHFGQMEALGTQYFRLLDGRQLVFYYASGKAWYSPIARYLKETLKPGDLMVFAYTDDEQAHLWLFAIPVEVLTVGIQEKGLNHTLDSGTKYSFDLDRDDEGFILKQLGLPLKPYLIVETDTRLTRALFGLIDPPQALQASTKLEPEKLKRLLRWRMDGVEERGEQFDFAEVRRRIRAIQPALASLEATPDEFTESEWKIVLDNLYSAHLHRAKILANNHFEDVRIALRAFLYDDHAELQVRFDQCRSQVKSFGQYILSELLNRVYPEQYPYENSAARAALQYFGFAPGDGYQSYQKAFKAFRLVYEQAIGERLQPDLSINNEIELLFNQLYRVDLRAQAQDDESQIVQEASDKVEEQVVTTLLGYTIDDFVQRTYQQDDRWLQSVKDALEEKGQIILYGPPGTGKTFMARELAKVMAGLLTPPQERYRLVQFHPAYSYEDFIEGIKPRSIIADGKQMVDYPVLPGVFRQFCETASQVEGPCIFIIDEINRGNIASIFGELMYALEYRDKAEPVILPYSGTTFTIPTNVYIIGTMNTADRSISLMDFALRRRFHFIRCAADAQILHRWYEKKNPPVPYLLPLFRLLKERIEEEDYQIGISYFMDDALTEERLKRIWHLSIEPYLETYFIDRRDEVEVLRWHSDLLRKTRQDTGGTLDV